MGSISQPLATEFVAIVPTLYQLQGAAGWVDTDISASVPASARALVFRMDNGNTNQNIGVRASGSALARQQLLQISILQGVLDQCDAVPAMTVELYREAAFNNYTLIGYWK